MKLAILAMPVLASVFAFFLMACEASSPEAQKASVKTATLDVYKSPTCGCCEGWIDHLHKHQLQTRIHHPDDLNAIKRRYSIEPEYQSCHTAVSEQGYVFEGHVPAKYIQQFLDNPPAGALGLAVPAMPMGSPGMEMGNRFTPYQVLLLMKSGESEVFATIDQPDQQH